MGYTHDITGRITIVPPIPAEQIPLTHPLDPHNHLTCTDWRTGDWVPATVYGHQNCVCAPDLMFEITDGKAHAIVPAIRLGHKLGAPVLIVEEVVAQYGSGRSFHGHLFFQGEEGEVWTIEVIDGRVQVDHETDETDEDEEGEEGEEDDGEQGRFTAWITTDTSCLDQPNADIVVVRDELRGEAENPEAWTSTDDRRFHAITGVDARDGDHGDILREAAHLLTTAGWEIKGRWVPVPTGYTATVNQP